MPELPEVETTIRYLRPQLLDRVINEVIVSKRGVSHFNQNLTDVKSQLEGAQFTDLSRIGKWMLFDLGKTKAVGHLRMSGRFLIGDEVLPHVHNRFQFLLDNGKVVNYIDQRRFGTFHLVKDFSEYKSLAGLGPDALSGKLTAEYLFSRLQSTKKPIYSTLLDQNMVAGLGNIYVNEALHASHIHPLQPANTLSLSQLEVLVTHIGRLLTLALQFRGTTLIDNLYKDPEGKTGDFAKMLQVYGKKKDSEIEVLKVGGRSVFVHKTNQLLK